MNEDFRSITRPTAAQVKAIRHYLGKDTKQMAEIIGLHPRTWTYYESGERKMIKPTWELLLIKISQQHPDVTL